MPPSLPLAPLAPPAPLHRPAPTAHTPTHASPPPAAPRRPEGTASARFLHEVLPGCMACMGRPDEIARGSRGPGQYACLVMDLGMALVALTAALQAWWAGAVVAGGQPPSAVLQGWLGPALAACLHALADLVSADARQPTLDTASVTRLHNALVKCWPHWYELVGHVPGVHGDAPLVVPGGPLAAPSLDGIVTWEDMFAMLYGMLDGAERCKQVRGRR